MFHISLLVPTLVNGLMQNLGYKNKTVAIKIVKKGESSEEIAKRESKEFIGVCKEPRMIIVTEILLGGRLDTYLAVGFALDIPRAKECLHSLMVLFIVISNL
ncbi:unnamed protein product, partial [Eruca vesicaria subsp. sativa]|nr:unnamed protein product [Eruca vesicaria subsp. sativa]